MPPETNNVPQQPDFKPKPIEQPMLDSASRAQIMPEATAKAPSGEPKGFYRANRMYVWAIAIGLLVIAVLAYLAFNKKGPAPAKEANVALAVTINGNGGDTETVQSGGEAVYKINIQNNDPQKLENLELELTYPEGVTYTDSVPKAQNLSGTSFKVPDLISGQNAAILVKTRVNGNVNDTKKLTARLQYNYSNFSSRFTKEQQLTVRLVASDIALEIDGPATANNAAIVAYTVKYKNNSGKDIKGARVQLSYPQGFEFAQADPAPSQGNNIWNIGDLLAGKDGQISIQGNFHAANPGESKIAAVDFKALDPSSGSYNTQASANFTTAMQSLPLLVTQELQSSRDSAVIEPGQQLTFSVKYQNNAATAATGVNIVSTLNSKVLDLATLRAEGGDINNNTITWNAASVSNLATLNPSDSGQLTFSVTVRKPATRDSSKSLSVVSDIKIKSNEYETYLPGNQLTLKVSSPVTVTSKLEFLVGQLPPSVGKATTYRVTLSLLNETNDYSDGVLTASLPGSIYQSGSVNVSEGNNVTYDSSTGKLTWKFGNLPAHTGTFSQPRTLQFNVKISPVASQAGQSPTLVKDIQLAAQDLYTSQSVTAKTEDINTSDISNGNGWSDGQVER